MRNLITKIFITAIYLIVGFTGVSQETNCPLKIAVKNSSKYQIDKLLIFQKEFNNIKVGEETSPVCIDKLYPSIKLDITFSKGKKWGHIIKQPTDNVGEIQFTQSNYYEILIKIKKKKGGYNVNYEIKPLDHLKR